MRLAIKIGLFLCTLFSGSAWAQDGGRKAATARVSGVVKDAADGQPLPGVSVVLKGTKTVVITDIDGRYHITVQKDGTLVFSLTGLKTVEESIGERNEINVTLEDNNLQLNEVVVVGYGTQRRKELTGAISTVSSAHLEYNIAPSVDALLSGAVAGVNVTQSSGQPGSPSNIRIRGGNSINASNDPLYVIDGFLFFSDNSSTKTGLGSIEGESNPLNLLNPADIESIEVLKDVSATAIYGSRGSNGVILITTRKGKKDKNTVNYQYSAGWSKSAKKLDLLNASQWARMQKDYFLNKPGYSDAQIEQLGEGYDWQNAVLQTGVTNNHALSFSGGDEKSHYFLSGNHLSQDGIILNSGFKRFVGRFNYDRKISSKFSIGINLTGNKSTQTSLTTFEGVNYNSSPFSKGIANSLTYALYLPPVVPFYNADGSYNYSNPYEYAYLREGNTTANPISDLKNSTAETISTVFLGNFYAQYTPIEGLTAKINVGSNISHTTQNYFAPSYTAIGLDPDGIGGIGNNQQEILLAEFTLAYAKKINDIHSFDVLAGFTYQDTETNIHTDQVAKFTNEDLGIKNPQDGTPYGKRPIYSNTSIGELYSLLGRINYSLLGRYHLTATFRSDYSTRFASNYKWGTFPSIGLAWNINDEVFLEDFTALNNLKLRLSAGSVGNQEIGDYEYLQTLEAIRYNGEVAYHVNNSGNENLKWEITTQYNIGIDAGFLNSRFSATADVYYKETSDLLLRIPPALGQENEQLVNVGNVVNKGVELSASAVIVDTRNVRWTLAANFARNINKITKLYGNVTDMEKGVEIWRVGESLGSFYGLEFDGVVQKDEDVSALPTTPAYTIPEPGDPKFKDNNNDNHIDKYDRVVLGSKQPDFTYGISTTLNFWHFDLFLLLQGSQGNKVYNQLRRYLESPNDAYNVSAALLDSWTSTNPSNTVPRITSVPLSSELDSRYVEDASYLRLKTVTLGYTLGKIPFVSPNQSVKIRFFATVQNLVTLSGYKGYDPEISKGIDLGTYPMARTFYLGANITF
ncbi:MAG: TonB-dependent receptor [Prevotellaceae bacterium]|jgi:TonB-linked SusC/RagA family outer membrane protein|nr:TonB-dependent receptor [Prevotellaceae bacterium]